MSAEPSWGERGAHALLNTDIPRLDAVDKVTGRAKYAHDMRLPGMVYAKLLCCPHPTAKVSVDTGPALEVPGVVDAMVLDDAGDTTRFLGQPIAVVAAETPEKAEDGVRALRVSYEPLPFAVTPEQSAAEGAPQVSERGNVSEPRERTDGDLDAGFAAAAATVEATYSVPWQNHACLETHGMVVDYRGGDSATVYASHQGTHAAHGQCVGVLELDKDNVEVQVQVMGGGFGGKFGIGVEGATACRLAKRLGRPVHLLMGRREEFVAAGNRSANVARFKGAMGADGRLLAVDAHATLLGGLQRGSYASQPYIYSAESRRSAMRSIRTHTDGNRAMRAPGHPQASFGIESLIDELAYAVGADLVEVRKKNLEDPVYHRQLDRAAAEIGWAEHPNKTAPGSPEGETAVGIGFGVSTWGGGGRAGCKVDVTVDRNGRVDVYSGTQDLGTGTRTYVAAIVAEELRLPLDQVHAHIGSSRYGMANASGGSVTTAMLAPAVKVAAHNAREALLARVAEAAELAPDVLSLVEGGSIVSGGDKTWRMSWEQACAALGEGGLSATGEWDGGLSTNGVHGAQAARVTVDLRTGRVKVDKMVVVQDCGLPLNRLAIRSQLNGGMIQALSYGLLEQHVIDPWLGVFLNPNFEEYKIAGSLEMPELVSIIDDEDDREAVVGIGEPPVIPGHSAIANAVHNACGARIRSLPVTPDKVLDELERLRAEGGR